MRPCRNVQVLCSGSGQPKQSEYANHLNDSARESALDPLRLADLALGAKPYLQSACPSGKTHQVR
jgi:hypothetical protein